MSITSLRIEDNPESLLVSYRNSGDTIRNHLTVVEKEATIDSTARIAPLPARGIPHHVTQRGNSREKVFLCVEDYEICPELMKTGCGAPSGNEEFVRQLVELSCRILRKAKPGPKPGKNRN